MLNIKRIITQETRYSNLTTIKCGATGAFAAVDIVIFRFFADWEIVVAALAHFVLGLLVYRLFVSPLPSLRGSKSVVSEPKFLPIPLSIGNSYIKARYLDPPLGDVVLGGVEFQLGPDSLIFDTDKPIRAFYSPPPREDDGSKEIRLQLHEPINNVKSAYFLINSGNSKDIYRTAKVGEIKLIFKDAPPLVTKLVLGENIREWCLGNPGNFIREVSSSLSKAVWKGTNKQGANAVIDCLKIPVYECMRGNDLEEILFIYKPTQHPTDTMGVHYSVFAVSLEIEQPEM